MSNRTAVFDSNRVNVFLCDIPIVDGRGDPFLKIEKVREAFVFVVGADGHVCRAATHDRMYRATLTLKGSSQENQKIAALHAIDVMTPGGSGIGGLLVKDLGGASLFAAAACWVEKQADFEVGVTRADCVWVFVAVADPDTMIVGGN